MDDHELLREYVRHHSEKAFSEMVARHLPLVYGTALRLIRDPAAAQDVAQTVFIQLARNAFKIWGGHALPGWLYRATQRAALLSLRREKSRLQRETTAMNLAEQNCEPAQAWHNLQPLLDEALGQLNRVEQDAVLMRFFDGCNLDEIGRTLSLSESAAQKRVSRALEKMRRYLSGRGLTLSAALLASTLDAGAKTSVPFGMATSISIHALNSASVATGLTLTSFLAMSLSKKLAAGLAAMLVLAGLSTIVIHYNGSSTSQASATKASAATMPRLSTPHPDTSGLPPIVRLQPSSSPNSSSMPTSNDTGVKPVQTFSAIGATIPLPDGRTATLEAGQTGYVFADGIVVIDDPKRGLVPYGFAGTSSSDESFQNDLKSLHHDPTQ